MQLNVTGEGGSVFCSNSDWSSSAICGLILIACFAYAVPAQVSEPRQAEAVQHHFAAARAAQQRKDYVTADREYRAILAVQPDFAEVYMNLGLLYQMQDQISPAIGEFRRALKLKPGLAGANFFLGVDYCKLGEGAQAIPYLQAALKANPTRPEIRLWLATAQEMSGQYRAEITTLKEALRLRPQDVDLLYLLGHAYEQLGKEQVARLQQTAPKSARSEQLLGESYATSSQWPLAVLHFQNALGVAPALPGVHTQLGEVLLQAGKLQAAAGEFEAELRLQPANLRALARKGEVELIQGEIDAALQDWNQALQWDQQQVERVLGIKDTAFDDAGLEQLPEALRGRLQQSSDELRNRNSPAGRLALLFVAAQKGVAQQDAGEVVEGRAPVACSVAEIQRQLDHGRYPVLTWCALRVLGQSQVSLRLRAAKASVEAGDYGNALWLLGTLPARDRQSPEALYWGARCYEKLGTASYLQLYKAAPDSYRAHQLMGDLEATRGDDAKAIAEYRTAIARKPLLPNLHYSLGHLLWKDLNVPEARGELQAELAINPRHAGALHDLGNTYLLEHHADQGLPYLLRALTLDPDDPDIHRDLGTAYSQLRQYQKAEAEYKLALASDHDGSIHYKLGRVYQSLGRKQDAGREFVVSEQLNRESHAKLEKQTQRLAEIENLPQ